MSVKALVNDLKTAVRAVSRSSAAVIAGAVSAIALALLGLWLPSLRLLGFISSSRIFGVGEKIRAFVELIGTSLHSLSTPELSLIFATAILFGLNVAFAVFYVRRMVAYERSMGVGFAGMLLTIFGFGCAACGSVLLSAFFGTAAALGVLKILPLHGNEFAIAGLVVMVAAILTMARRIASPEVCAVPQKK